MIRSEISAYRLGKNSFRIVIKKDMKNELFSVFVLFGCRADGCRLRCGWRNGLRAAIFMRRLLRMSG